MTPTELPPTPPPPHHQSQDQQQQKKLQQAGQESSIMPLISPFSSSATKLAPAPPAYRPAKRLPFELEEQVRVYLEEALYPQALHLLTTFLTTGLSSEPLAANRPAYIPPPSHLSLLLTLAVHPSLTTRTQKAAKHQASGLALQYLALLAHTVGPLTAKLSSAYAFPSRTEVSRRGTAPRRRRDESPTKKKTGVKKEEGSKDEAVVLVAGKQDGDGDDDEGVMSEFGAENSLFAAAGDAWSAVGWALNCSVAHKKRWAVWERWLGHVLDVLERDWALRRAAVGQEGADAGLAASLLAKWVKGEDAKRILRAVFANGRGEGVEFGEVWRNETKERKRKEGGGGGGGWEREKVKVDVENGEFGDYFQDSEDDEDDNDDDGGNSGVEEVAHDAIALDVAAQSPLPSGTASLGGAEALALRMRLLALLCSLAWHSSHLFTDLFYFVTQIHTFIRPFPLVTYAAILSPSSLTHFEPHLSSYLVQYEAVNLVESAAPKPYDEGLNMELLEQSFLPWAANTSAVADNAKLGACVETLVRMYDNLVGLDWTEELQRVTVEGIERRQEKAKRKGGKKGEAGTGGSEIDAAWLRGSGERIKFLVQMAMARKMGA